MRGFIFIYGSEIVLRFLAGRAFQELEKVHDLTFVFVRSSDLVSEATINEDLIKGKVEWVPLRHERFRRWNEQFDISYILHQDKSSSFAVRYQEQKRADPGRFMTLEKLARPGIYESQRERTENYMGLNPDIINLVLRDRPDFFVLPSALLDYVTDDVLQIAAKLRIPTLMLVSGWDNLSSKGLLYHQPTMMGVWGEQSRRHALTVQGTDLDRVHVIGAPHYESFRPGETIDRSAFRSSLGIPIEGHAVLFAGTLRLFDETQLLKEVDEAIEAGALPPMHIVYRPHPWRDARRQEEDFFAYKWRHVTMDPQIVETYKATKATNENSTSDTFMFRLQHLSQLYQSVDALISPMSTVLLEGLLFGLPTMAVAFNDGKHSWSADKVSRMMHFKELYEVPGLLVCRAREQFFPLVQKLLARIGDPGFAATLRQSTDYFVHQNERPYGDRVVKLVEKMLTESDQRPAYDTVNVKPGKTLERQRAIREAWQQSTLGRTSATLIHGIRRRIQK